MHLGKFLKDVCLGCFFNAMGVSGLKRACYFSFFSKFCMMIENDSGNSKIWISAKRAPFDRCPFDK